MKPKQQGGLDNMRRNYAKTMGQLLDKARQDGLPVDFMIAVGKASRDITESKGIEGQGGSLPSQLI